MPLKKPAMNRRAFTLIEVIVAAFVLATALGGLVGLFLSGKRHILHVRYRGTAAQVSKYFLDLLHSEVSQANWSTNCLGSGANCPGVVTIDNIQYTPTYTRNLNSPIANVNRVRLNITWTEP